MTRSCLSERLVTLQEKCARRQPVPYRDLLKRQLECPGNAFSRERNTNVLEARRDHPRAKTTALGCGTGSTSFSQQKP